MAIARPRTSADKKTFDAFYSEHIEGLASTCLPILEKKAVSFLGSEIKISDN